MHTGHGTDTWADPSTPAVPPEQLHLLTDVDRTIDSPEAHRQPVENLPLFLYLALRECLVHDPQQEVGR